MQYIQPPRILTIFFNVTSSLASSINFNQMTLHLRSVFANLRDTLKYLCTISMHTMDYINAATTSKLSPHVLPVTNLQQMLQHIATTLPPTLHLPISPMDTLHFYRYLRAHALIKNKQFSHGRRVIRNHSQSHLQSPPMDHW